MNNNNKKKKKHLRMERAHEPRGHDDVGPLAAPARVAAEAPVLPAPLGRVVHVPAAERVRQLVQQREVHVAPRHLRAGPISAGKS